MVKISLSILFIFFLHLQAHAQNRIGKLSIKPIEYWKMTKNENNLLQMDYQKASTRVQFYILGDVNSDQASQFMVDLFKKQNVDPVKFQKAVQSKYQMGKTESLKFNWTDEMYLDSQSKTMVTAYQIYLLEYKSEKYYIFTTDYFIKEDQASHQTEIDNFISQISLN